MQMKIIENKKFVGKNFAEEDLVGFIAVQINLCKTLDFLRIFPSRRPLKTTSDGVNADENH
jgi:hypothetical protein